MTGWGKEPFWSYWTVAWAYVLHDFWCQIETAALLAWVNNSDIEAMPPTEPWDGRFDCPEQWI